MPSKFVDNPDYILNPSTKRYVKKTSKIGKQLSSATTTTPSIRSKDIIDIVKEGGETSVFLKSNKTTDNDFSRDKINKLNLMVMGEIKKIFGWKEGDEMYLGVSEKNGEWRMETSGKGLGMFKINKYGLIEKNMVFSEIYRLTTIFLVVEDCVYNKKIVKTNKKIPSKLPFRFIDEYKLKKG